MEAFALRRGTGAAPAVGHGLRETGDEELVRQLRDGDVTAFEQIVERYRPRLFAFCRRMLRSPEDAEDVLQEVLANAYRAMLADQREIQLRPWLYRIARNRCLNHLQRIRAVPEEQERLERIPTPDAAVTHERVQNREEFRQMLGDLQGLPDSQRRALLLCELDGLSYEQVGEEMTTTVPAIRSLLTRARTTLAESSMARQLTCDEVQIQLFDALEEGAKATGPVRRHLHDCPNCTAYRDEIGSDAKALAALSPLGLLVAARELLLSKLGGGAGAAASTGGAGAAGVGGGLASGIGAAGWTSNAKLAAATLAVAAAAGGAGHLVAPADSGQLQRIAPVLRSAPPAPSATLPDASEPSPAPAVAPTEAPTLSYPSSTASEGITAPPPTDPIDGSEGTAPVIEPAAPTVTDEGHSVDSTPVPPPDAVQDSSKR